MRFRITEPGKRPYITPEVLDEVEARAWVRRNNPALNMLHVLVLPIGEEELARMRAEETEIAHRVAEECLAIHVPDIEHWPVRVDSTSARWDKMRLICDALTQRDFGSGEKIEVKCRSELLFFGSIDALRENLIRHLRYTRHCMPWYWQPDGPQPPSFMQVHTGVEHVMPSSPEMRNEE